MRGPRISELHCIPDIALADMFSFESIFVCLLPPATFGYFSSSFTLYSALGRKYLSQDYLCFIKLNVVLSIIRIIMV